MSEEGYYVIDPEIQVRKVTVPFGLSSLNVLQEAVGGLVEHITLMSHDELEEGYGIDMWVNEEGLVMNMPPNFPATFLLYAANPKYAEMNTVLRGPAVITCSDATGETLPVPQELMESICTALKLEMPDD